MLSVESKRTCFETYKSNVCHYVKNMGDIAFIIHILKGDKIRVLYQKEWYPEALYLLAMVDYLSREHEIPLCIEYNDIRTKKFSEPIYPSSVLAICFATGDEKYKKEAVSHTIPEFLRHNIIESEIRNVC